ncbi:MAG: hypothetical protein AAFX52_08720 [Pseudomonadota bacterium]
MHNDATRHDREVEALRKAERVTVLGAPRFAAAMIRGDQESAVDIADEICVAWDTAVEVDGPVAKTPKARGIALKLRGMAHALRKAVINGKVAAFAAFNALLVALVPAHAALSDEAAESGFTLYVNDTIPLLTRAVEWAQSFLVF